MQKEFGIRIKLEDGVEGVIVRRLDASSYEIYTDDGRTLIMPPEKFKEIDRE